MIGVGNERVFTQLLEICPDLIDGLSEFGSPVLYAAARGGQDNLVARILTLRPEMISVVDDLGRNALSVAVDGGHQSTAEQLLAIKPDLIYLITGYGDTILHRAVRYAKNPLLTAKLWQLNPKALTQANYDSNTPFYFAVSQNEETLIELFMWSLSFDEILATFRQVSIPVQKLRL